jgi:ATP-binding cassette subfamily B protein
MTTYEEDDDKPRQLDLGLWRRVLRHARPYRGAALKLSAAGLAAAGVDALLPYMTGRMLDGAIAGNGLGDMRGLELAYGLSLVVLAVSIWALIVQAGRLSTGVAHDLRQKGFARLQELPFSFYDTRATGWLIARMTSDVGKVSGLLPWFLLELVWGGCVLLTTTIVMFILDPWLALVVLSIAPPMVAVSLLFQRWLLESSRKVRRTNARLTAGFTEAIAGVRTTKALSREAGNLEDFSVETGDMFRYSMRNALQSAAYLPLIVGLSSVGMGLALWKGGVELGHGLTIGTLVTFMQYATLFAYPIQDLARRFTELQSTQAAVERVQGLLETEPEIADAPAVRARLAEHRQGRPDGIAEDGYPERITRIEARDVEFAYKPGEPVLRGVSFDVHAGQTVALVGPTGGGKSTIVSLIARFYEVTDGSIAVDGVDLRDRGLHWLQSNLGVVLQTPHLFSGTVADNIRYGRLEATDEEIRAAAARVHADAFIQALPEGYDTEVGEGGSRLSTGQRQLVSLARAVLADPQIFIMDEATSSVDTETEAAIQRGIEAVLEGRIAFVIAHRLSTIVGADQILVVEDGRITERGTHRELLRRGGHYAQLHERNAVSPEPR